MVSFCVIGTRVHSDLVVITEAILKQKHLVTSNDIDGFGQAFMRFLKLRDYNLLFKLHIS